MYVKSMVLDGFKSYGKRIEINGFDKEFNAITGLNGSGKSNILDAICFVLGITALGQVRATSLQELVYKSGQAGVKKASVTITFDNNDKASSPIGYESYEEITVTRQVVIDGKNKYLINGTNVTNKRVQDMFCSVQLNVNNPHFLIMQGRITKVLNMKPLEILSMIEEAAGTRMYEEKKEAAMKTIEKKNNRLREINEILTEEIGPKLVKLKEERAQFVEYQRIERELEHCRKIVLAWKYVSILKSSEEADVDMAAVQNEIETKRASIDSGKNEIQEIEKNVEELLKKIEAGKGTKLETLEQELEALEKKESKLMAEANSNKEYIKAAIEALRELRSNVSDDRAILTQKEADLQDVGGKFERLRETDKQDAAAVLIAQENLQKINAGLLLSDSGENATLEQQLINTKQIISQAETEVKQCNMKLVHNRDLLKKLQVELKATDSDYPKYNKELIDREKQLKVLNQQLQMLNYDEATLQTLQRQKSDVTNKIKKLQDQLESFVLKHPYLRFEYQDPHPNFNRQSVKGLVCTLLKLKEKQSAYALDIVAGNKLYNVVVDTEKTSKALLQHGQLQQRVTIIPLNKINGRQIDDATLRMAQNLVGKENVQPALSLIEYPDNVKAAMTWVFGQTFVCKDSNVAKTIAFHEKIQKKCVTLEGDTYDPSGSLSGGAPSKSGSILLKIDEFKALQDELKISEQSLQDLNKKIMEITKVEEKYTALKNKIDLQNIEVTMIKQRLEQMTYHKVKEEITALQNSIIELEKQMESAKIAEQEGKRRASELEAQLKDSVNIRKKQSKDAENMLKIAQDKAANSRKEWEKYEHGAETLNLEISELRSGIAESEKQILVAEKKLEELEEKKISFENTLTDLSKNVIELRQNVKKEKNIITQWNKEIQNLSNKKEDITNQNHEFELSIKKLNHEINSMKSIATECTQKLNDLLRKNEWINHDKAFFGEPGGIYDFARNDPTKMAQKLHQLETLRNKLGRNINTRALNLLNKEEERYSETLKKRKIVENDKKKILDAVSRLEEKKKETLLHAWEQVNRDFGSIFSSLLPGADAKLQPTKSQNVLDGLEVKIGFSGIWKESLGELSGGQKSLVALSLILAMLLFKPAPLYILDEVDAALDLSHTQNIGTMLKRHFKHSQFIIVSLKDGMFNNANVLFTTRFTDGMSTISRVEKGRNNLGEHSRYNNN
ncbi:hypothetical protein PV328_003287 [Microctonus aethiopoides]|uniref:Structural maintenance of chromosomes protein n=1 Tax=Microctonus aethiopoides TaxID=144406 RepID=A0AA39KKE2_9HYME|nr:hypothetical protein PV328_003287 [Microctonus aethiopoides]